MGRWRRPAEAARVELADLVRGLPRRVEVQFKRHWNMTPMLWNLYFRERVNFGQSLAIKSKPSASVPEDDVAEDAATAAARCYQRLREASYIGSNLGYYKKNIFFKANSFSFP